MSCKYTSLLSPLKASCHSFVGSSLSVFRKIALLCAIMVLSVPAFAWTVDGIKYEVISGTNVKVTGVSSCPSDKSLVVPSTVTYNRTTYTVTEIGYNVFNGSSCQFVSVTIPGTVKTIDAMAFKNQNSLKTLNLSEGLEVINAGAFEACDIEYLEIPSTVTKIQAHSFKNNTNLCTVVVKGPPSILSHEGCESAGDLCDWFNSKASNCPSGQTCNYCKDVKLYVPIEYYQQYFEDESWNNEFDHITTREYVEDLFDIDLSEKVYDGTTDYSINDIKFNSKVQIDDDFLKTVIFKVTNVALSGSDKDSPDVSCNHSVVVTIGYGNEKVHIPMRSNQVSGDYCIVPKELTLDPSGTTTTITKVYDGSTIVDPSDIVLPTLYGVIDADTAKVKLQLSGEVTTTGSYVGDYANVDIPFILTGEKAKNYKLPEEIENTKDANGVYHLTAKVTITPRSLTLTCEQITVISKTYDGKDDFKKQYFSYPALTEWGVLPEDVDKFTVEIRANTGNSNVGTYSSSIIVYLTSGSNNDLKKSYGIYNNGDSKANPLLTCTKELTITPKEITTISYDLDVTPHTYDCSTDDKDDVTISSISVGSAGEVIGADADNLSLAVESATLKTPNVTSSTTTTVVVKLTGSASGNYVFNLKSGSTTKTLTTSVVPAPLNISGTPSIADHAYDGTTNAINDVNVGTINLTGIASCDSDFTPTVKSAVLSQSSPTGGCDGHDATCTAEVTVNFKDPVLANYTITGATKVSATEYTKSYTLTTHITPRLISPNYTLTATNRVYNAKKDVTVNYTFKNWGDGVLAADQKNLQLKANLDEAYIDNKNVGDKTVYVPLTLIGSAKSYYKLTDDCSDFIATTTVKISQYPFKVDASIIPDAFDYDCDNTVDNINATINKNLQVYYDAVKLTDEDGNVDDVLIEVDNSQLNYSNGTWTVTTTLSLRGNDRGNYSLSPNQFTKTVIVSMDDVVTPSDADIDKVNAQSVSHTYDCTTDAKNDYAGPSRISINGLCTTGELYYELTSVTLDNANVGVASKATAVYTLAGSALNKQDMYGLASTLTYTIPAKVVAASLTVDASSIPSSITHSYDGQCSLSTSELSQIPSTLSTVKNPTNSCDALVYDRVSVVMSGCPDVTTNATTTVTYSLTDASDQTLKNYGLTSRNYVVTIPTTITALPIEVTVALNTNCIKKGTTDVKDLVYATISTSPIYGDVNVVVVSATASFIKQKNNYYCNITVNVKLSGVDADNYTLSKTQYTLSNVDVCDNYQLTVKGLEFQDHVYDCGTDISGDVIAAPYVEIPNKRTNQTDKVYLNCKSATIADKNVGVKNVTATFTVTFDTYYYDYRYYISDENSYLWPSEQTWSPQNYKINVVEAELALAGLPSIPDEIEYSGSTDVSSLVNLGTVALSGFESCDTEVKGVIRSATLDNPAASVDCDGNGSSSPVTVVVEFNSSTLSNYTSDDVVKESSSVWTKTYTLSTTVKPKTISPTVWSVDIASRVYDGTTTIDPATVTINSDIDNLKVSSDDVYLEVEKATLTDMHAGDAKAVVVVYKLGGADADNYALAGCAETLTANATAKITPYPLDLTDNVSVKSQTFNCDKSIAVSDVTVSAPNALSGDKLTASVESASYLKGSDSWVATVYLKLASARTTTYASDYTLVPNPVTKTITVNPTSVSFTEPSVSTVNHTYDCTGDIYDDYLNAVGSDVIKITGLCSEALTSAVYYKLTSVVLSSTNYNVSDNTIKATATYTLQGTSYQNLDRSLYTNLEDTYVKEFNVKIVPAKLSVVEPTWPKSLTHAYDGTLVMTGDEIADVPTTLATTITPANGCDVLTYQLKSVTLDKEFGLTSNPAKATALYELVGYNSTIQKNYGLSDQYYKKTINVTVTPRELTVTPEINSCITYTGSTTVDLKYITTPEVTGIAAVDAGKVTINANRAEITTGDANVGTGKVVTVTYTVTGGNGARYTLANNGKFTVSNVEICPAPLTPSGSLTLTDRAYDCTSDIAVASVPYVTVSGKKYDLEVSSALQTSSADAGTYNVSVTLCLPDALQANYDLADGGDCVTKTATVTISKAELTVTGAPTVSAHTYDGTTNAAAETDITAVALTGMSCDESYPASLTSSTLGQKDATDACGSTATTTAATVLVKFADVDTKNYTISGAESDGVSYKFTVSGVHILPKEITPAVTAPALADKAYDAETSIDPALVTLNYNLASLKAAATDDLSLSVVSATMDDKNAGKGKAVTIEYALSGASAANYKLAGCANGTVKSTITVTPKELDYTDYVTVKSQTYNCDGAMSVTDITVGKHSGIYDLDDVEAEALSATYAQSGTAWTASVNIALSGDDAANYTVTPNPVSKAVTVSRKPISFTEPTVSALSHAYDCSTDVTADYTAAGGPSTIAVSGLCDGLDVHYELQTVTIPSAHASTYTVKATYALAGSGLTEFNANRDLYTAIGDTYEKSVTVTVTPAALTINDSGIPASLEHTYDGTTSFTAAEIEGLVPETLTTAGGCDALTYGLTSVTINSADAGSTTAVIRYDLSKTDAQTLKDYGLDKSYVEYIVPVNVKQRELTVEPSLTVACVPYTGSTDVSAYIASTLSGVQNGDAVSVTLASATIDNPDVTTGGERRTITLVYTLDKSAKSGNYTLADGGKYTIKAEVCAEALTVSGDLTLTNRAYDCTRDIAVASVPYVTVSGKKYNLEVNSALQTSSENAGTYNVSVTLCLPDALQANYDLADGGDCVTKTATVTISKAELTVTGAPTVSAHTYDGTTNAAAETDITAVALTGMSCDESYPASLTSSTLGQKDATDACGSTATTTAATVLVKFADVDTKNYTISGAESDGVSYKFTVSGVHILPKEITPAVTAPALADKAYDAETSIDPALVTLNYNLASLKAAATDDLSLSVVSATMDDKNAGKGKAVTIEYALSGASAANYKLAGCANGTVKSTITVTPKELDYTDYVTVKSQTYNCDGAMSVTDITVGKHSGIYDLDDVEAEALSATYAQSGTAWTASVNIALSGDDAANYTVTPNPVSKAVTVSRKPISFTEPTVSALSHAYDCSTDVTADYTAAGGPSTIAVSGLCDGLDVHYELQTVTIPSAHASTYTVKATYALAGSGLTEFNANRDLYTAIGDTYEKSVTVTVTPAALTINDSGIPASLEHTYDGTTSFTAAEIEGLVPETLTTAGGCDALTYGLTSVTINSADAGSTTAVIRYDLSKTDAQTLKDYGLDKSYVEYIVPVNVKQRELTVEPSLTVACVPYTGSTDVSAYIASTLSGVQNGDAVSVTLASATIDNPDVTTGGERRTITLVYTLDKSAKSANYTLSDGGMYTIKAEVCAEALTVSGSLTLTDRAYDCTSDIAVASVPYVTVSGKKYDLEVSSALQTSSADAGTYNVSVTLCLPDALQANYDLADGGDCVTKTATVTISKAELTVTGAPTVSAHTYDGTTNAAAETDITAVALTGMSCDESYPASLTSSTLGQKDATDACGSTATTTAATVLVKFADVDTKNYTISGAESDGVSYKFTVSGVHILPKEITPAVTAPALADKAYDAETSIDPALVTLNYNLASLKAAATDDLSLSVVSATMDDKNAGKGKAVTIEYALSGASAANYKLAGCANGTVKSTITVTPKELDYTDYVTVKSQTYNCDGAMSVTDITVGKHSGIYDLDDVEAEALSATYAQSGTAWTASVNIALSGDDAANYTVTPNPVSKAVTVSRKPISFTEPTVSALSHAYDCSTDVTADYTAAGGPSTIAVSGLCDGLDVHYELQTVTIPSAHASTYTVKATYALAGSGLTEFNANRDLYTAIGDTYEKSVTVTVTPAALTINDSGIPASLEHTYDGTTSFTAAEIEGLVPETLTTAGGCDALTYGLTSVTINSADAGSTTAVIRYDLSKTDAQTLKDYGLDKSYVEYIVPVNVKQRELTVEPSLTVACVPYTGSTDVSAYIASTLSGVQNGDAVSVTLASATIDNPDVTTGGERRTITLVYTLDKSAKSGNYTLADGGKYTIKAEVCAEALTVSGDLTLTNRAYDCTRDIAVASVPYVTVSGKKYNLEVNSALQTSSENAGTYNVSVTLCLPDALQANYDLADGGDCVTKTATVTISKAELTVTGAPTVSAHTYDGTTNAAAETDITAVALTGMSCDESYPASLTSSTLGQKDATDACGSTATTTAATVLVKFADVDTKNYTISGAESDGVSYKFTVSGVHILPKEITPAVTAPALADKAYDAETSIDPALVTLNYNLASLKAAATDDLSLSVVSATMDDKNAGKGKAVTIEYALSGASAANYKLAGCANGTVKSTITVTPKELDYTDYVTVKSQTYNCDGAMSVTDITVGKHSGIYDLDDVEAEALSATYAQSGTAWTASVNIALSGDDAANYTVTPNPVSKAVTVSRKPISFTEPTVSALSHAYDCSTDVTADYTAAGGPSTIAVSGLCDGLDVHYELQTVTIPSAHASTYTVKATYALAGSGLTEFNANRDLYTAIGDTYEKSVTVTVTPAALTINDSGIPASLEHTYDGTTSFTAAEIEGLVPETLTTAGGCDALTYGLTSVTINSADAGSTTAVIRYDLSKTDAQTLKDYGLDKSYVEYIVPVNVKQRELTVEPSLTVACVPYTGSTDVSAYIASTLSGVQNGDAVSVTLASATIDNPDVTTGGERRTITLVYTLDKSAKSANYTLSDGGKYTITAEVCAADLFVNGDPTVVDHIYDGSDDATADVDISNVYVAGVNPGEICAPTLVSAKLSQSDVTTPCGNSTIGHCVATVVVKFDCPFLSNYTVAGLSDDGEYTFTIHGVQIVPATIAPTVTASVDSRVYNAKRTIPAGEVHFTSNISDLAIGDDDITLVVTGAKMDNKNVGTSKPVNVYYELAGADANNYKLVDCHSDSVVTSVDVEPFVIDVYDKVVIASNTVFNCNGTLDATEVSLPANADYNILSDEKGNLDDIDLEIVSSSFAKSGDNWKASVMLSLTGGDAGNYILEPNPIEKDITVDKAEAEFDKPLVATVEHVFDCNGDLSEDYAGPATLNFNGLCDRFSDIHYEVESAKIIGSDYNVGNHDGAVVYVLKGTNIDEFLTLYNVSEQYTLDVVVDVKSANLDKVLPDWPTEIVHVYDGKNSLTDGEIDALGIERSFVAIPNPLGDCANLTYTLESVTLSETDANVDGTVAVLTYKLNGFDSVVKKNYGLDDEFFTKEISARIEPRELTVTASVDGCFTYNGSTEISAADFALISGVVTNKVEGDDVDVKVSSAHIISGDANVGDSKTISVFYELVGSDSGNYILNNGGVYTLNDVSVCVAKLVVKGNLTFNEHTYDCSTDVKADVAELPYVETLDGTKVFLTLNVATSTDKNVGNHSVNATLTLDGLSNYVIESTGTNEIEINTSSVEVVQRVLSIADDVVVTKPHSYDCSTNFNGELTTPSLNNVSCDEAVSLTLVSAELNTANCGPAVLSVTYKLDGDSEIVKNYRLADDSKNIETSIEKVVVNVDCLADVNIVHTFDCSNDVYADANLVAGNIDIDPALVCGTTGVRYVLESASIDETESNTLGTGKATTLVYRLEGLDDEVRTYYSLDAEKVCTATTEVKASTVTFSEPVIPAYIEHVYDCSNDVKAEFVANGGTEKVRVTGMCAMDGSDVYYELVSVEMYSADGVYVPSSDAYETTATYVIRNMTQEEAQLYSLPMSFTRVTSSAVVPEALTPVCPDNLTVSAHTYNFSGDVTSDYEGTSEVEIDVCGKNSGDVKYVFSRAEITDESGFAVGNSRETTVYFSLSGLTDIERSYFTLPESMSCKTTTVVEPAIATIVADAEVSGRVYNGSRELDVALVKLPTVNVVGADNKVVSLPSEAIALISATLDDKNAGADKQATISFQLVDDFANNFIFEGTGTTADITVDGVEVSKLLITLDAEPQLTSKSYDGTSNILESQVVMPNITNIQVDDDDVTDDLYLTFIAERSHINGTDFNVGTHTATVALGVDGGDAQNYYLEPDEWSDLSVIVTPQKLTIVGQFETTESRVYNGKTGLDISKISVPELYYADGTPVNPDDVHIVVTEAKLEDKNAGEAKKVIIKYELSSDNYSIGDDGETSGIDENMTIDVDKLDVILNPTEPQFPEEKKFDCLTHVDMVSEPEVANVMTDDSGALDDVYLSATESDLDDANVGVRTATYSVELLGVDKDNYRLITDSWSANVTVTPAELELDLSNLRLDAHVYDCGTDVLADFADKTNVLTATGFTACHDGAYFELVSATIGNSNVGLTHTTLKFELRGAELSDYGLTEDDLVFTINTEVQPAKLVVNSDISIESLPYTGATDVTEQVKATGAKPVIISGLADCDADAAFEVVSAEVDDPTPGSDRKVTIVYTLNGADGRNYGLTESDTVIVINTNIIAKTLTGADKSKLPTHVYDSTTDDFDDFDEANLPDISAGVITGDDVRVELVSATLDDPNVGSRHTTLVFRLIGDDAAKYKLDAETETQIVETEVTPCVVSPNAGAIVAGRDYDGSANVYAESVTLPTFGTVYDVDIDDVQLEFVSGVLDDSQIGARTATIYLTLSGDKAYNYTLDPDYVSVETEIFDSRKVISVDDSFLVKDRPYDGTTSLADTLITLPNIIGLDPADEGSVYLVIDTAYIDSPNAGERIAVVNVRIEGPKASFYKLDDNVLQTTMNVTKLKVTLDGPVLIDSRKEDGTLDVSDNLIHLPGLDGVLDMDIDDVTLSIISARLDSATAGDRTVTLDLILTGAKADNYELVVDDPLYVSMKITKDKKDDVKPPHVIDDEIVSEKEMIVYNIEGRIIGKGKQVKVPESGLYVCLIGRHAERILVP